MPFKAIKRSAWRSTLRPFVNPVPPGDAQRDNDHRPINENLRRSKGLTNGVPDTGQNGAELELEYKGVGGPAKSENPETEILTLTQNFRNTVLE